MSSAGGAIFENPHPNLLPVGEGAAFLKGGPRSLSLSLPIGRDARTSGSEGNLIR